MSAPAQAGQLAAAMSSFLVWTAGRYEDLQEHRHLRARLLRSQVYRGASHPRLPGALADSQISLAFLSGERLNGRTSLRGITGGRSKYLPFAPRQWETFTPS